MIQEKAKLIDKIFKLCRKIDTIKLLLSSFNYSLPCIVIKVYDLKTAKNIYQKIIFITSDDLPIKILKETVIELYDIYHNAKNKNPRLASKNL